MEFSTVANPVFIPVAFAKNGAKNFIYKNHQQGQDAQDMTWNIGAPPITMIEKELGGKPPKGQDFNGVFNAISEHTVFIQNGGRYKWSQDVVNENDGYPKDHIVQSNDGKKEFISTTDNNKNNPNTNMQGWLVYSGQGSVPNGSSTTAGVLKVINSLDSNDVGSALSAAQGNVLGERTKAATTIKQGIVRFADSSEVQNASNVSAAVKPSDVKSIIDSSAPKKMTACAMFEDGILVNGFGFSSLNRAGTGVYEVILSTNAPNTNYIVFLSGSNRGSNDASSINLDPNFNRTRNTFRIACTRGGDNSPGYYDPKIINIQVFE